jgi:hypothetical protein
MGRASGSFKISSISYYLRRRSWEERPARKPAKTIVLNRRNAGNTALDAARTYGEAVSGTFNENERFTPSTGAWDSLPPLPTARHGLAAVAVGNRIYVLAGGPTPGGSASSLNEVFIVPPEAGP